MLNATCHVDLSGFHALEQQTDKALVDLCIQSANAGAEAGAREAKSKPESWFKNQTGLTRASIVATAAKFFLDTAWGDYRATSPWAWFLEYGTKKHPIVARNAPNLVFWWALKGYLFIGKRVEHPGSYARRFMSDRMTTWWKAEQAALRAAEQAAARIAQIWN